MARALYIHWPFCLAKCPYCDFNSHVRDRVDHDLWQRGAAGGHGARGRGCAGGEALSSIFFGGGTPSLMPPALVERLLAEAERLWGFAPGIEITLEGNPSSVEAANYAALAAAGINRASLGIQALDDETLRFLGRLHDAAEGLAALEVAQRHFGRVSFDLIYARPGQTRGAVGGGTGAARSVVRHRPSFALPAHDRARHALRHDGPRESLRAARRRCGGRPVRPDPRDDRGGGAAGLRGQQPRPAWRGKPAQPRLLALSGLLRASARARTAGAAAWPRCGTRSPENWLAAIERQGDGIAETRALPLREQASEALLMGLRLAEGVDLAAKAARFGVSASRSFAIPPSSPSTASRASPGRTVRASA